MYGSTASPEKAPCCSSHCRCAACKTGDRPHEFGIFGPAANLTLLVCGCTIRSIFRTDLSSEGRCPGCARWRRRKGTGGTEVKGYRSPANFASDTDSRRRASNPCDACSRSSYRERLHELPGPGNSWFVLSLCSTLPKEVMKWTCIRKPSVQRSASRK